MGISKSKGFFCSWEYPSDAVSFMNPAEKPELKKWNNQVKFDWVLKKTKTKLQVMSAVWWFMSIKFPQKYSLQKTTSYFFFFCSKKCVFLPNSGVSFQFTSQDNDAFLTFNKNLIYLVSLFIKEHIMELLMNTFPMSIRKKASPLHPSFTFSPSFIHPYGIQLQSYLERKRAHATFINFDWFTYLPIY